MYLLAKHLLRTAGGSCRAKALLAFVFFFFNGGLGFLYFLPDSSGTGNFTRIFTAFYETPTNYVTENVQWHNIICDMLIPQRATLFGWAILFAVLYLLHRGRQTKDRLYFLVGGILAGSLVLVHTHSFLALGILCAGYLLQDLAKREDTPEFPLWIRLLLVILFLAAMSGIRSVQTGSTPMSANTILTFGLAILGFYAGALAYYMKKSFSKEILLTWGVFLGTVLVLALPQLLGFTFQQAQGEQFVRGSFNWANSVELGDSYILFYVKNLGILFVLVILMLVFGSRKQRQLVFPAAFLWLVCEFILFQPNPYDNNKLLLVAYLFFCIAAADFVWETVPKAFRALAKPARIATVSVTVTLLLATTAAILTMGREYVSDYELFSSSYVKMAKWVEKNTEADDIFLTANNHNNAVASLTGRNIVCGSGSFLYYHGIDYGQAEADVTEMYQNPNRRKELLKKYNVRYIVIGWTEQYTYSIPDLADWIRQSDVVFNKEGLYVLAV